MKSLFLILLLALSVHGFAQISVDTTRTTITVHEKLPGVSKTLSVYRSFVQGSGVRNQAIYQPVADNFGDEPETLNLSFSDESVHIKKVLDAALARRSLYFSSFSINISPYNDLLARLVDIYSSSQDWNDYLKKATNLHQTTTLFDGSEITETHYYTKMAKYVLDKSDFATIFNEMFLPYGYKVAAINFPEEHQRTITVDKLMLMGKDGNLLIPVPDYSISITKIKP